MLLLGDMAQTFFFYDLETSGLNPRYDRVMQFAGIRTDTGLNPIGDPINILVKVSDDILPSPDAVMVTGITPQATLSDGISEKEFCELLVRDVFTPETMTVGFNNVRFDDEFIRHTLWRHFYDPYEWAWADGRSRWDLLDVVRMTRALRPGDIKWPVNDEGKPVNKLEKISAENGLAHVKAHDALSDVEALIAVARLIRQTQPKLFDYLLHVRDKRNVESLVNLNTPEPFVYASGKYDSQFQCTTVAFPVCPGSKHGSVVVYDLRHDPGQFADLSLDDIKTLLFGTKEERGDRARLPLKELSYNKCPAVAPIGVWNDDVALRLGLTIETIRQHRDSLLAAKDFGYKVREAYKTRDRYPVADDVEGRLYDSFTDKKDQPRMAAIRAASPDALADFHPDFVDERLPELLLRYKARLFPHVLSEAEQQQWERYRAHKINAGLPEYLAALQRIANAENPDTYLLEELQLWAESIVPHADA